MQKNSIVRSLLVFGIITLFVSESIIQSVSGNFEKLIQKPSNEEKGLDYISKENPGNFLSNIYKKKLIENGGKSYYWLKEGIGASGVDIGLSLDSYNQPHIRFVQNNRLYYAKRSGDDWNIFDLSSSNFHDNYGIAIDSNGYPRISYDKSSYEVYHIAWNGSAWNDLCIDNSYYGSSYSSIAIDPNGYSHIAYCHWGWPPDGDLKYVKCTNQGVISRQTIDTLGNTGAYPAIALDSRGYPHITYQTLYNELRYARWNGSIWTKVTIDNHMYGASAIALDKNDYPHIAYEDSSDGLIKYSRWNGYNWDTEIVESGETTGFSPKSFALDSTGTPHIVYSLDNQYLRYARKINDAWYIETIDENYYAPAIAIDNLDIPHIAYRNSTSIIYATLCDLSAPIADFTWTPSEPLQNQLITFDASASYDPNGYITLYEWDWDNDGIYDESHTISTATHSWSEVGNYPVKLRVTDNESITRTITKTVVVGYYFIHVTDTHVGTPGGLTNFLAFINHTNHLNPRPTFVVISGDLVHFGLNPLHWYLFFDALSYLEVPCYLVPGNHDHMGVDQLGIGPWMDIFFPDGSTSIPAENLHLMGLDSGGDADFLEWVLVFFYGIPMWTLKIDGIPEATGLSLLQFLWLSSKITEHPEMHNVIFMHHPVVCDDSTEAYDDLFLKELSEARNGCILNYRDEFLNLCRNNVDLVLGGHTHSPAVYFVPEGDNNNPQTVSIQNGGLNQKATDSKSTLDIPTLPLYILTSACGQSCDYRNITVHGDEMRVYGTDQFKDAGNYEMSWIPWGIDVKDSGRDTNQSSIPPAGRVHVYDSYGNHVGINDTGGIDFGIPGAYYEDQFIYNETSNTTTCFGELIAVEPSVNEYTYKMITYENSSLNITGELPFIDGGTVTVKYSNISALNGSIGTIYLNGSLRKNQRDELKLYWDDNGDGTNDAEFQPNEIIFHDTLPSMPNNPTPTNNTINVSLFSNLTWDSCVDLDGDTVSYEVFLGINSTLDSIGRNLSEPQFSPGLLSGNTTYYWRVIAWDDRQGSTVGPLWHFTTESGIDSLQSYVTLTNENIPFLVTCPAGDGPFYQHIKVTCRDAGGNPLPGIPANVFTFILGNVNAIWYDTLSCTFTAVDPQTNANGEIRFEVYGDTSIYGNITIQVTVQGIPINDIDTLPCKSVDYDTNGVVSLGDFVIFASDYSKVRWRSDFTGDGLVSLGDFVLFAGHYAHHS